VVVDRADSGCPGAAYAVVALWIVLWSVESTFVVWLRDPSAPVIVTPVINPNVPSYVVTVVVPASSVDEVTRPWLSYIRLVDTVRLPPAAVVPAALEDAK
jgi:hypothetical protein